MNRPFPGRLIALEGIDGCGKSTQAAQLAKRTGALLTREPGGTPLGIELRTMLLDPARPALVDRAEALLMVADRAQHVAEVIRPALEDGRWVVTDRFSGSTLAYQGWGRGLDLDFLGELVMWATNGLVPDLSIVVDVELVVARQRRQTNDDRLELLDESFHGRVREGYFVLAKTNPDRWVIVDGSADATTVADAVDEIVAERVGQPPLPRSIP